MAGQDAFMHFSAVVPIPEQRIGKQAFSALLDERAAEARARPCPEFGKTQPTSGGQRERGRK
jgi:hypothetical protein